MRTQKNVDMMDLVKKYLCGFPTASTFNYQNHLCCRLPIIFMGLILGTYKIQGFGSFW